MDGEWAENDVMQLEELNAWSLEDPLGGGALWLQPHRFVTKRMADRLHEMWTNLRWSSNWKRTRRSSLKEPRLQPGGAE